jgi:hypothetical protein
MHPLKSSAFSRRTFSPTTASFNLQADESRCTAVTWLCGWAATGLHESRVLGRRCLPKRVQASWILRRRTSAGQPQFPHQESAGTRGGSACNKVMFVHRETAASRKASTFAL